MSKNSRLLPFGYKNQVDYLRGQTNRNFFSNIFRKVYFRNTARLKLSDKAEAINKISFPKTVDEK